MREELNKDEGIAGEIYRAVGNDKILKSVDPNDKEALASVIQSATKNIGRARGFVRKDGSNTVKNGPISDKEQAKYPLNTPLDGDNSQRKRVRQFIQSLSNPKESVDGNQLLSEMLNAVLNADNVFDIPQALINSHAEPRDKLFLASMIMPTINPNLAKDGSMYKFVNEMFSYGNTQLFSNQQIRQHLQDALDDKKSVRALINKHTANRKVESAKDTITARLV